MNLILDEQLDSEDLAVSRALNILTVPRYGCRYRSMRDEASGMKDEAIPKYCKDENIDLLVSLNVRDFAAKLELFRRLLAAGVSVAVLRMTKRSLTAERQLAILAVHSRLLVQKLKTASGPILLILTENQMRERTLDELVAEIQSKGRKKLP